ncbi:hypothetical protein OnM2_049007 [Erysiphe neolycopersici]|uniref:Zn(2)-C6 fungal-type domain-containing protein n=1 Tax=Erysiphe neolycopersici TaxID=212602 RepID=A0A420HT73_9PEZI|nr:hypothetical protein OnM2_049007 [Erysiphe neolycopersici]
MALRSDSCGNGGSSPSRGRTQDSDRPGYTTGFEPQGIRKSRGNQRNSRTQQSNLPFNNSAATQNRSSNSGASSSGAGQNTGTRRRIPVACGRCRKRKIRCSGDNNDGLPCQNCKAANAELCEFFRVNSRRITSSDLNTIANVRNAVPCNMPQTYGVPNSSSLDTYQYRNNTLHSSNTRPLPMYDMGSGYDFPEQSLGYGLQSSAFTALPIESLPSNYSQPNMSSWNNSGPQFTRNPSFPDVIGSSLYSNSVDERNITCSGLPSISSPIIGSQAPQQLPVSPASRFVPTSLVMRSLDNYQAQGDFPFQSSLPMHVSDELSGNMDVTSPYAQNILNGDFRSIQAPFQSDQFSMSHFPSGYSIYSTEGSLY